MHHDIDKKSSDSCEKKYIFAPENKNFIMKILYYDCFAGISGDMNLGALLDLGVCPEYLKGELKKLNLDGYELRISQQQRKEIAGTRVEVVIQTDHNHIHNGANGHSHGHGHSHSRECHHEHRTLKDVEKIIRKSRLSDKVKSMSMDIFRLMAKAESKIHGKPLNEVHFHEVGAVDSIIDIVGAAICIENLAPDRIISSPVEMGGGFVTCAHGQFPVPAPATLEIMKGKPMKFGAVPFETATPTGVAILATLASEFTPMPSFNILKIGYGVGSRDGEIPNVLRVCLAEKDIILQSNLNFQLKTWEMKPETLDMVLVECNIDDMSPERYPYVMERLFEAGADDVYLQNIIMKKSRPAVMLSALCTPDVTDEIERLLFTETTTLGIRYQYLKKAVLDRRIVTVDTQWGPVRVKEAYYQGYKLRAKPEYDDCVDIAHRYGISIKKVYEEIIID